MSKRHSVKLVIIVALLTLLSSCATQMSLEDAKKVTIATKYKSFIPPPRRVNDILSLLNKPGQFDTSIVKRLSEIANAKPPENADEQTLAEFYYKRGLAAKQLGRSQQAIHDLYEALRYRDKVPYLSRLQYHLANEEKMFGNFRSAIELAEDSMRHGSIDVGKYAEITNLYLQVGDFEAAKKVAVRAQSTIAGCFKYFKLGQSEYSSCGRVEAALKYLPLEAQGRFAEAEGLRRTAINWANQYTFKSSNSEFCITERIGLAENLLNQGRLVDAEMEAREALKEAIGLGGKQSPLVGYVLLTLGNILINQGRLEEAEQICKTSGHIMEESGISTYSSQLGSARTAIGNIMIARKDYTAAMKQFDIAREGMLENKYLYETAFSLNPNLIIALVKAGRIEDAIRCINHAYEIKKSFLGETHPDTLELIALRAMARVAENRNNLALQDFSLSVPFMLQQSTSSTIDYLKRQRLQVIFESYLDFLARIHGTPLEKEMGIHAEEYSFKIANTLSGQTLYGAVGESSARAAASQDVELSDLVRREQDTKKEIVVLNDTLVGLSAIAADQQVKKSIKELQTQIDTLTNARTSILSEIRKRFPKYTDFVNPRIATVALSKSILHARETLILIYSTDDRTHVWAIPYKGEVTFHVSPVGKKEISEIVTSLRKALDAHQITLGDIPDFNISLAHKLYSNLLKPVEKAWKDAPDLLIVVNGPLSQLPLSILPMDDRILPRDHDLLFSRYRQIPWLIRKATITMLPSVSSLITFRSVNMADTQRKAFLGFGDPIFNREQLAYAESEEGKRTIAINTRGKLQIRGVRITPKGNLDDKELMSSQLAQLDRLPDTAEEIRSIAQALDADPIRDVFLGKNASVGQVKSMNLSDRKVISFATHALVAGDLDGLDQPALALSSPIITGDADNGLLTMGEILTLKMNADWIILSACNTAAAEGNGLDALSGLVRAFFYAGTRSVLASMYPVESTSAKKLITGIFQYQKSDKSLSRSGTLQKSMLALIDEINLVDEATGKVAASYAHPFFWAPFIIVGDPGSGS